jgi:nucleoside-diphosphate-sugar epimerase
MALEAIHCCHSADRHLVSGVHRKRIQEFEMKVFVAGATGAMGVHLIPQLVANGHDVVGTTRSEAKQDQIRAMGARPAVVDALDADAVAQAVAEAEPEVIVHQLTALSRDFDMKHFDETFAVTNRLRTEGTDHLLAAGRAVEVKRFVAQSYAGWPSGFRRGPVTTEEDPLDAPPDAFRTSHDAIRYLEEAVTEATWTDGIVLRYGGFYGPGTGLSLNPPGDQVEMIRKRKFPVVGAGAGVWSFVHIADAAAATVAAVEHGEPGLYNIVDDEPAPVAQWLPAVAEAVGAKKPRHVPVWLGRLFAGEAGVVMMTEVRGASNEKAKRELGWRLRYPTWREGFATGLGQRAEAA